MVCRLLVFIGYTTLHAYCILISILEMNRIPKIRPSIMHASMNLHYLSVISFPHQYLMLNVAKQPVCNELSIYLYVSYHVYRYWIILIAFLLWYLLYLWCVLGLVILYILKCSSFNIMLWIQTQTIDTWLTIIASGMSIVLQSKTYHSCMYVILSCCLVSAG